MKDDTDWLGRWKEGKIGWHSESINDTLIKHNNILGLEEGDTVFVPLCGKSKDMVHFLQQGVRVIGVEVSELGVKQFFDENLIKYSVKEIEKFIVYYNDNISIYCGDFFNLSAELLESIHVTYDRASLIALPKELRRNYVRHLQTIIPNNSSMLLLTLNYPQSQMNGPPFAVNEGEVNLLYSEYFDYQHLECTDDTDFGSKFRHAGVDFVQSSAYYLFKKKVS